MNFLLFAVLFCIGSVIFWDYKSSKEEAASKNLSYDENSRTLTLKARSQENENVIKIQKDEIYTYAYHPAELVYTGATVGGVHTGGFHTQGDYFSAQGTSSGKYELVYKGVSLQDKYCPISKIKLATPDLIKTAKKNSVMRQFLKDDGMLVLSHESASLVSANKLVDLATGRMEANNAALTMSAISMQNADRALTKSECQSIKDWICADSKTNA